MSNVPRRGIGHVATIRRPPSVSVLGRGHSFARTKPPAPGSTGAAAYVLYAIVFQETSVRHTRARTLFVLLPRLLPSSLRRHVSGRASSLFLFKELYQSHFAPGSCFSSRWQLLAALRAKLEGDTVSLSFSAFLRLYVSCPETLSSPLFTRSILLRREKGWSRNRCKSIVHLGGFARGKIDMHLHEDFQVISGALSLFSLFEYLRYLVI